MSQPELAHLAGISKTALANIEIGRSDPRASTLVAAQRALEKAGVQFHE
ncbi:MAG TPA: helix-turn-helix domain-containing protein [Roseiarcus sp.]|nr:helix-turn-helix domain-containing protein [Roseiarcus sp.]